MIIIINLLTFLKNNYILKKIDSQTNAHIPLWVSEERPGSTDTPWRPMTFHREVSDGNRDEPG